MRFGVEKRDLYGAEFMAGSNRAEARSHHWKVPELSFKFQVPGFKLEFNMKISFLVILAASVLLVVPLTAAAQSGAKQGPQIMRDAELEKDSLHNLKVAQHYFKLRKAYVASLQRCEEIIAANPAFSRIDEALYIAGQSSLNLAEGKGKQNASLYVIHDGDKKKTLTADEFRELARGYFSQLVSGFPESKLRGEAENALRTLGGPKTVSKQ